MVAAGCAREDSRLRQAAENFESLRATTAAIGEAWLAGDVSGTFASTALDQTFRMLDLQRTELTASPRSLVDPRGARLSRVGERLTRLGIAEGRPLRIPFADFTIRDAVRADRAFGETAAATVERRLRAIISAIAGSS